ncbi:hypothetical protein PHYSODRAFT_286299 [Phytophthora sojae]|uniref:Secreted protein n=1 Tax=Phytophthora sojae (strain P6497) TaxID=1094619 RepID=G4ZMJ7_PHYSP|nr:hypothetical protein PHYSODRAFT_286299 [Phytophthora sojae]EGZ15344.1 hypothetical protein PHYSODRAFT_286299 [Phytophthora sojae]|eukprot:XP_009529093.1 hypothetical protein PHYSODRAFT_286299 [Phytophthora sojae]
MSAASVARFGLVVLVQLGTWVTTPLPGNCCRGRNKPRSLSQHALVLRSCVVPAPYADPLEHLPLTVDGCNSPPSRALAPRRRISFLGDAVVINTQEVGG